MTLARGGHHSQLTASGSSKSGASDSKSSTVSYSRNGKSVSGASSRPPELPPRSLSPASAVAAANNTPSATNTISSSWHGQQDSAAVPLGRSSSTIMTQVNSAQHLTLASSAAKSAEKVCVFRYLWFVFACVFLFSSFFTDSQLFNVYTTIILHRFEVLLRVEGKI